MQSSVILWTELTIQGLGGPTKFTVSLIAGVDKVRHIFELYIHYVFCLGVTSPLFCLIFTDSMFLYVLQQPEVVHVFL